MSTPRNYPAPRWATPGSRLPAAGSSPPAGATATGDGVPAGAAAVSAEAAAVPVRPRRGPFMAGLVTARPRQWVKNALIIAAPGAAGALGRDDVPGRVAVACIAFCLISAGIYALNDSRDVAEDRRHPRKRFRPIAAGELSVRHAVMLGTVWLTIGLAACFYIRPLLGLIGLGYVILTLSYTAIWRHVLVLDILVVAAGFVLRALAGGAAAPVALSRWFVLVISAAALFVAAGKRHAELLRIRRRGPGDVAGARRVMRGYSERGLRLLLAGSGAVAVFAYWVWAFGVPDVDGFPWRPLTAIPFTVCLIRYGMRVQAGGGEAPEEMVLTDRVLILGGLVWLILFALNVHAGN